MTRDDAIALIENALEYWVEVADYEDKEKDIKETDKAWALLGRMIHSCNKNDFEEDRW